MCFAVGGVEFLQRLVGLCRSPDVAHYRFFQELPVIAVDYVQECGLQFRVGAHVRQQGFDTRLPFGTFGALAAVWLRGLSNDVYFQIGLVTLLGLAAKNAILIVEYALLKKAEGYSASAAAMEAARLRFRPILMTSLAFILGVAPLAISTGAGAGARHAVGTGVAGGVLAATFLAIFFIPLFYRLVTDRRLRTDPGEFDRMPHRPPHTPTHHTAVTERPA